MPFIRKRGENSIRKFKMIRRLQFVTLIILQNISAYE